MTRRKTDHIERVYSSEQPPPSFLVPEASQILRMPTSTQNCFIRGFAVSSSDLPQPVLYVNASKNTTSGIKVAVVDHSCSSSAHARFRLGREHANCRGWQASCCHEVGPPSHSESHLTLTNRQVPRACWLIMIHLGDECEASRPRLFFQSMKLSLRIIPGTACITRPALTALGQVSCRSSLCAAVYTKAMYAIAGSFVISSPCVNITRLSLQGWSLESSAISCFGNVTRMTTEISLGLHGSLS